MNDAEEIPPWPPMAVRWLRIVLFLHFGVNLLLGAWLWLASMSMIGLLGGDSLDQSDMVNVNVMFLLYAAPALPLTLIAGIVMERRPATARKLIVATWIIAGGPLVLERQPGPKWSIRSQPSK